MASVRPTFSGEVMLAGWIENHNSGAKVSFWLPDPTDLDVFRGLTVKKGNVAGHRFAMVLVEIDDDEKPKGDGAPVKGGDLSRLAGIMCAAAPFRDWFWSARDWMPAGTVAPIVGSRFDEDETAEALRLVCGVTSRAELDHNAEAAERFHELVRKPYNEHITGKKP